MRTLLLLSTLLILACMTFSNEKPVNSSGDTISYTELQKVTGRLGHPLGEIISVEGVILDEDARQMKEDLGKTLLKIEKVNEQKLAQSVVLSLEYFALSKPPEAKPGDKVKYAGYESGRFDGIPSEAFKYIPMVATQSYHFSVYFQVCKAL